MNALITLSFPLHSFGTHHDTLVKRKILALLRSYDVFVAKLSIENPELSATKEIEKDQYEIGDGRIHARIIIFANGGKKKMYSCSIRGKDEQSRSLLQQAGIYKREIVMHFKRFSPTPTTQSSAGVYYFVPKHALFFEKMRIYSTLFSYLMM